MIVLKDKGGRNTKYFPAPQASEAQKLVDGGKWFVDTDKTGAMKPKKTTKK